MIGILLTVLAFLPGDVRFPMETVTVPTVPEAVQRPVEIIRPDEWYIVEADGPQLCWVSFDACLEVEALAGPMTFRGRFAGGTKVETRTFPGPYIFAVTGVKSGKGELTLAPVGVLEIESVVRQVLTVSGPRPPPDPDPIPPGPTPVASHVRIEIVHDAMNLPEEAAIVFNRLVNWNEIFDAGSDYRLYDLTTPEPRGKAAIEAAKGISVPAIIVRDKATDSVIHKGALPKTFADLQALIGGLTGG